MATQKTPLRKVEDIPEKPEGYHRGGDSMKDVKRAIDKKKGVELGNVASDGIEIREPDSGKHEIKEPPRKKPR